MYIKITESLKLKENSLKGKIEKIINTITSATKGAKKYWIILAFWGKTNSLEKSLIASLNGCINPIILTLFGPLRIWL